MHVTRKTTLIRALGISLVLTVLHLPGAAHGAGTNVEPQLDPPQGSRQDMIGDLVLQRPFGLANTLLGIGTWIVSLPFTVFSGSTGDAATALIVEPAANTFTRPLGYPAPVRRDE
jgi:hypothetical protein